MSRPAVYGNGAASRWDGGVTPSPATDSPGAVLLRRLERTASNIYVCARYQVRTVRLFTYIVVPPASFAVLTGNSTQRAVTVRNAMPLFLFYFPIHLSERTVVCSRPPGGPAYRQRRAKATQPPAMILGFGSYCKPLRDHNTPSCLLLRPVRIVVFTPSSKKCCCCCCRRRRRRRRQFYTPSHLA